MYYMQEILLGHFQHPAPVDAIWADMVYISHMLNKTSFTKSILVVIAALIIVIIGYAWLSSNAFSQNYSIVYATSGEIYIGHLSTFPQMVLTDAYVLNTSKDPQDPTKSNFLLQPFAGAVWATDKVILNPKNIIFYGPLAENSKALEGIRSKTHQPDGASAAPVGK